jgi:membrane protein involved in colicin uptake
MLENAYTMRTPLKGRHAMPSQSRAARENQMKLFEQCIQDRRAYLEKKGIAPKELNKDRVLAHLKAKRRAIMNAIAAIDAIKARTEHPKEAAAEPAAPPIAAPKEKKPKKEKAEKAEKAASAKAAE